MTNVKISLAEAGAPMRVAAIDEQLNMLDNVAGALAERIQQLGIQLRPVLEDSRPETSIGTPFPGIGPAAGSVTQRINGVACNLSQLIDQLDELRSRLEV